MVRPKLSNAGAQFLQSGVGRSSISSLMMGIALPMASLVMAKDWFMSTKGKSSSLNLLDSLNSGLSSLNNNMAARYPSSAKSLSKVNLGVLDNSKTKEAEKYSFNELER